MIMCKVISILSNTSRETRMHLNSMKTTKYLIRLLQAKKRGTGRNKTSINPLCKLIDELF
jgi:hypothetical protein